MQAKSIGLAIFFLLARFYLRANDLGMNTVGEHLKAWRKKRGITQQQFAEASGISQGTISMIEGGADVKTGVLRKINTATGGDLSPNLLVLGDGSAGSPDTRAPAEGAA